MTTRPAVFNTHIHLPPNFSAFESVEDALDQAQAEGCAVLGTSNYYDFSVYETFVEGATRRGIAPTCGIEILCWDEAAAERGVRYNDPANPGKVYLCGKGLTRWQSLTLRASELMAQIRRADEHRMADMAAKLQSHYLSRGIHGPSADQVIDQVATRQRVPRSTVVLQERHLAQSYADVTGESAADIRNSLMKTGKPAYVEESFVSLEEGIELVRELGGIPAYPFVVDGMNPVSEMERDLPAFIDHLWSLGISFAEFIPNRNSPDALLQYVPELWAAGIPVTAGTEHNTPDSLPILPRCKDGSPIPEPVMEIFWQSTLKIQEHEANHA